MCGWLNALLLSLMLRINLAPQIRGMEEGMHTMRVGGKRRIVIPKELGYSVQGLGPYPAGPRNRDNLANVRAELFSRVPARHVHLDTRCFCGNYLRTSATYVEFQVRSLLLMKTTTVDARETSSENTWHVLPNSFG